ncbi:hypothetical protein GCM10007962_26990 [Yeosuana aromativorans]|uniref:Glycine zipper domain-containing protein n=1 Tax=Yeosuana aromativorans TaxID=288019 RepID=A0A8J3BSN2_9FLAO|nr:hypothetical protein [Yeosuana aromativorans]GGK31159.1 hypothetical protein GCM10007962_26990 [Yeosuana aromativorans]
MNKLILLLTLLISISISAQENKTQNLFVRVFDMAGKKIGKGHIYSINDSLIILSKSKKLKELHLKDIGKIKTKHSGGNNILIGATTGVLVGAILGSVNPPTDSSGGTFTWAGGSSGDELASGVTVGVLSGTIIGSVSALFKNSKTFIIEGNKEKWHVFAESVNSLYKRKKQ